MKLLNKKNSTKCLFSICLCIFLCTCFAGCNVGQKSAQYQHTGFAMGTVISQNMYGGDEGTANQILDMINELEQTISWRIDGSDVFLINEAAGTGEAVEVGQKTVSWLADCERVYKESGGALDITVGPVSRLWDIGGENPGIPEEDELAEALAKVNGDNLSMEGNRVLFSQEGGQLDLGAVGKGIACDEIANYIEEKGLVLNGTFSVGGSVLVYGAKPDGNPWRIGIRDPRGEEGDYMGALTFSQKEGDRIYVSTSGDYEKYFEENGVRYHHIIDPATGTPAESDLMSVTVISGSGFLTDALSTACFVAGEEGGLDLAQKLGAEVIMITKDDQIVMTEGAQKYFELLSEEYYLENEEK